MPPTITSVVTLPARNAATSAGNASATGAGASIKMTPASIKLSVLTTTYELTPMGHKMAVPANTYSLTPTGESASVMTSNVEAQVSASLKGNAMVEVAASGQTMVKGAMVMIN